MLFVRGAAGDFDSWAALGGGDAWTHKSLLPFFQKLESVSASTSTVKASPLRGTDGPMPCNLIQCPQETTHAFIESTASSGVCEKVEDYNAESIFGVSMSQYNVRGGRRWNTATAYLVPALAKYPNLHVLTHAHAQRVLFGPNKEALGVAIKKGSCFATMQNQPETIIRCRGEVILSGGAIGSPQLLELSGIGRPEVLTPLGIPIIAARSGVGENLQDHLAVPVFRESKVNTLCGADENIGNIFKFVVQGTGALTGNMVESLAWLKTPAHPRMNIHPAYAARIPDLQFHFLAGTIDPKDLHVFHTLPSSVERLQKLMAGGLKWTSAIMPTLLHPQSIGTVHITSKHAQVQPAIDPHYLERQEDVDCLVEGCLLAEKIYREPAIAKISGRDLCDEFVTGNPYKRTGGAPGEEKKYWEYYVR
jgi:choline dehydrogenase